MPRKYELKKRALAQEETRLRITQAAMNLHGSVGPAATTISAVADLAGVQRPTVYRHFPDEAALFQACSAHWLSLNPPPDPGEWAAIEDPEERLERALSDLYAFYGRTETMMANLLRDRAAVPIIDQMMGGFDGMLAGSRELLMTGRRSRGRRRAREQAAIGHALEFDTWRSLVRRQGLGEADAVQLMRSLVGAL
jgi:AcrR family transcriptional regulator